ncbi:cobyrinate a,c-diamide synthase [Nostocoides sp. HKS02]|nr:cobyrinate a,c-diamide synthase [Tetrasphaera sp. HKS02]
MVRLPRFVVAAAASGQGKTTVAVGIMAALSRRGLEVAPAKVGPDYIDPGYHALATGRPGRNLDPWLQGEDQLLPLLLNGFRTPRLADLAVVEGVMGLFDGRLGTQGWASTAHVATVTSSPVVLVVDISSAARTVAATVHGLRTFDSAVRVAGVVLNKSGSPRHADEVRRSVEATGVPVLGVLPRDAGVSAPSRHLGLVPAAERPDAESALDRLAEQTARFVDLDALLEIASTAPDVQATPWSPPTRVDRPPRVVAVAGGRAFTFRYAETDELLRALGCEPVVFDPAVDTSLPTGTSGIYLGGGFPEVYAASLATNRALLAEVREAVAAGVPTVAECAGLLYLSQAVDGHALVGAVPAQAAMHPRLTLRYRTATTNHDSLLGPAGTTVRGHEFHRTRLDPGHGPTPAWLLDGDPEGFSLAPTGRPSVHASYLHTHWAGHPELAAHFAAAVHASGAATSGPAVPATVPAVHDPACSRPSRSRPSRTRPSRSRPGRQRPARPPRRRRARRHPRRLRRQRPGQRTAALAGDRAARRGRHARGIPSTRRGAGRSCAPPRGRRRHGAADQRSGRGVRTAGGRPGP